MPVYLELTQFIEQSIHLIMIQKPHHPHSESRKVANPQTRKPAKSAIPQFFSHSLSHSAAYDLPCHLKKYDVRTTTTTTACLS